MFQAASDCFFRTRRPPRFPRIFSRGTGRSSFRSLSSAKRRGNVTPQPQGRRRLGARPGGCVTGPGPRACSTDYLERFRYVAIKRTLQQWSVEDSTELYGIRNWGAGYFGVSSEGDVVIYPSGNNKGVAVSVPEVIRGMRERGYDMPVLLRIENILDSQITLLHESFRKAIDSLGSKGEYRGVFPIKVNQQRQVVEEIAEFGTKYDYGLEAGSKPELIAAMAHMHNPNAYLICNGYKDDEFIDLALTAQKMGLNIFIVLEMPSELDVILERARRMDIRPNLGVRIKLAAKGSGLWQESAGDKSVFGLNAAQVVDVVDKLKQVDALDCLKLLHYHQGSQIPNISVVREGLTEAARIYVDLVKEGAPLGTLDMGGGLAVDYDGSKTNFHSSCNYSIAEFARDVVEVVGDMCTKYEVPHPTLVTESGRAVVAYYSVLVFNVLDVTSAPGEEPPPELPEDAPELLKAFADTDRTLARKNMQECYNDACYYRDQLRAQFFYGNATLRQRGLGEAYYWHILSRISRMLAEMETIPEDLRELSCSMVDFYYGNFSLFQSLPDSWAIRQLFPVMPLHRLNERPTNKAVLADITCDCDGKIDHFIDREDVATALPLHAIKPGEDDYYIGVFLVGAYQETLGDLHNLLGDTNVVGVHLEGGRPVYTHEVEGDTVADVLSYVEYDPKELINKFRTFAEQAVADGKISPSERRRALEVFRSGLNGYTYYEL